MKKVKNAHHKDGWYEITPKDAAEILGQMKLNRAIRTTNLEKLVEEIKSGAWVANGESIVFDEVGNMIDGQHRLTACMRAGKPIISYCVFGVKRSAFDTFDTGATRGANDLASILKLTDYKLAAGICGWMIRCDSIAPGCRFPTGPGGRISQGAFEEFMQKNRTFLEECVKAFNEHRAGITKLCRNRTVLAGVFGIAYRSDKPRAVKWLESVATGLGLDSPDHPVMALRTRLVEIANSKRKPEQSEVAALGLKSFIAYRHSRRIRQLKYSEAEEFPRIGE